MSRIPLLAAVGGSMVTRAFSQEGRSLVTQDERSLIAILGDSSRSTITTRRIIFGIFIMMSQWLSFFSDFLRLRKNNHLLIRCLVQVSKSARIHPCVFIYIFWTRYPKFYCTCIQVIGLHFFVDICYLRKNGSSSDRIPTD